MRKIIALSTLLALGALGMACGDAASNNTTNVNKIANAALSNANAALSNAASQVNAAASQVNAAANQVNAAASNMATKPMNSNMAVSNMNTNANHK